MIQWMIRSQDLKIEKEQNTLKSDFETAVQRLDGNGS